MAYYTYIGRLYKNSWLGLWKSMLRQAFAIAPPALSTKFSSQNIDLFLGKQRHKFSELMVELNRPVFVFPSCSVASNSQYFKTVIRGLSVYSEIF